MFLRMTSLITENVCRSLVGQGLIMIGKSQKPKFGFIRTFCYCTFGEFEVHTCPLGELLEIP